MKNLIIFLFITIQILLLANASELEVNKEIHLKFREKVFNAMMMGTLLDIISQKQYSDLTDRDKLCFQLGVAQGEGARVLDIGIANKSLFGPVIEEQLTLFQKSYHGFTNFCGMNLDDGEEKRGDLESLKEKINLYKTPLEVIYRNLNENELNK